MAGIGSSRAFEDHLRIIQQTVHAWHEGHINIDQKRHMIGAENQRYYGRDCPGYLYWPPRLKPDPRKSYSR